MSSPIPPDPYLALGVAKDADISAIRSSHRKLALKLHPDRIKDEAEKLRGKDEFQKVQQAYELLSDPDRRSRYDDRIKLAALRKEAMTRDSPMRSANTSYAVHMRPSPSTNSHSSRREFRAEGIYEERRPEDYFGSRESFTGSSRDRFEDEPPRASSRKYEVPDERERRSSTKTSESSKSKKSAWDAGASGMSLKMGLKFQAKAKSARDRVSERKEQEKREKELDKEKKAAKAKFRDQEQRRDRLDKAHRRVYVEDDSSSDSDTATQVTDATVRGPRVETVRPSSKSSPRSSIGQEEPRRSSERSRRHRDDDDDDEYADSWEERYKGAADYMASSGHRPTMGRSESNYWQDRSRISGSDSDRRPTSSKGRRADGDGANTRPPSMPSHKSSPANLRNHLEERAPQRSASGSSVLPERERERRSEPPSLMRSKTMPNSRSSTKKDTVPAKGSNLKHAETHDSGYGSSSSPHTPELGGTSPPRDSREFRREAPRTKTKYQIVEPAEDDDYSRPILGRTPTVILDDDDRHRRFQSSPERRSDKPERPRIVTSDRTKSSRVSSSKAESLSARKIDAYGRRDSREERDYVSTPRHRENMISSRRPSVDVR
jgi:curved DNA-binding protein CbpA